MPPAVPLPPVVGDVDDLVALWQCRAASAQGGSPSTGAMSLVVVLIFLYPAWTRDAMSQALMTSGCFGRVGQIHCVLFKFGVGWGRQGENRPSEKSKFFRQSLGTEVTSQPFSGQPSPCFLYFLCFHGFFSSRIAYIEEKNI